MTNEDVLMYEAIYQEKQPKWTRSSNDLSSTTMKETNNIYRKMR